MHLLPHSVPIPRVEIDGGPGDRPPGLLRVVARGDQAHPPLPWLTTQARSELVVGHDLVDRPDLPLGLGSVLDQVFDRPQRLGVASRRLACLYPRAGPLAPRD